jgi:hypothetical protein
MVPIRILWPLSTDPKPAAGGRNGSRRFFPRLFDPSSRPLRSQKSGGLAVRSPLRYDPCGCGRRLGGGFGRAVRKAAMNAASNT